MIQESGDYCSVDEHGKHKLGGADNLHIVLKVLGNDGWELIGTIANVPQTMVFKRRASDAFHGSS
jgi:hypothetical protein